MTCACSLRDALRLDSSIGSEKLRVITPVLRSNSLYPLSISSGGVESGYRDMAFE